CPGCWGFLLATPTVHLLRAFGSLVVHPSRDWPLNGLATSPDSAWAASANHKQLAQQKANTAAGKMRMTETPLVSLRQELCGSRMPSRMPLGRGGRKFS